MQKPFRRFELLLPTRFNSGDPVPEELLPTRCWIWRSDLARSQRKRNLLKVAGDIRASSIAMN